MNNMATSLTMRCTPCSDFQLFTQRKESNGLYVTDLPPQVTEEDIYRLFSNFGPVADIFLADSGLFCLVHYLDRYAVEDLLRYPPSLFGRELRIKRRQIPSDKENNLSELPRYHGEVLKLISQRENCKQQVEEFVKGVEADESNLRKQSEACRDLESALRQLSSTYKIFPFGSSITGLAFKDSDLDIFYGKDPHSTSPNITDVFNKVKKVISKNTCFSSMRPIPNARVPIIKLVHRQTGYNFDISFRNTMGVENSKMIRFLMSLDERIRPLFMIVKYWAKIHHLTGKRMSNYALILLLINFLQSLNEPILPPLCELQHDGIAPKIIGDWDAKFDDSITRLRPTSNVLPVEELLSRFFEGVVKTDFDNYVVSPLLGSLITRKAFYNLALPPEMKNYTNNVYRGRLKIDSALCLQDPIELNLNVTKNFTKHEFQCFKDHCYVAAKLSYAVPPHLFLPKLLSTVYEYPNNDIKRSWMPNPLHLRPLRSYMTLHVPYPENLSDEIPWKIDLTQKITLIFKKVLKIHVEFQKRQGVESKPGDDQSLACRGSQVLWKERDKLWKQWFSKKREVVDCESNSDEDVQVLQVSKGSLSTSHEGCAGKRKRDEAEGSGNKRRKTEDEGNVSGASVCDTDVVIVDSGETDKNTSVPRSMQDEINLDGTVEDTSASRSLQDEINLTNDMVKKGHALPATSFILDFTCMICKSSPQKITIEIADRRSRNNYFSSLCGFLQDFFTKHIIDSVSS